MDKSECHYVRRYEGQGGSNSAKDAAELRQPESVAVQGDSGQDTESATVKQLPGKGGKK